MNPFLVDTHCHLDYPEYKDKVSEAVEAAKRSGVGAMLTVGTCLESSRRAVQLTREFPEIYAAIGTHPHDAAKVQDGDFAAFESLLQEPKVVAIGETGLDYYYENSPREDQRRVFIRFLEMARSHNTPCVFHIRDAHADFYEILRNYPKGSVRGVLHCFSAGKDEALEALDQGFYISFTGILTFKKAVALREVARVIPNDRILVETDAPFLAPQNHRGQTNEPAFTVEVAEVLAQIKGVPLEEIARLTTQNCQTLFGFPR